MWFPFINAFNYSFIRHSFNMSHPTQSLSFNVPYYIFMVNQVFQLLICFLSSFVFCVGPKILLNNLLSNTNNFCLMFSVNTQRSYPYTATGLITVWYSLSLVFLVISLFWSIFLFAKKDLLLSQPCTETIICSCYDYSVKTWESWWFISKFLFYVGHIWRASILECVV